ncbi:tripartite tricarboxylate transporter substrate-binding protein [Achromobacter seleniivolatilans]|uniref:Tripartite tricarboxylate transporter substrate-binding protein n=1 Tax=Achromobacter seleniivolatilans TaxID=3047478 RepID=A0ABY9M0V3_9BURK|nr:tripartite tricarboxylate transporter substrate-binding protein [Achromobacter sp. R39]WMD20194.1 tripartite tricarboxylate transporter substrate-binding protein [Achromobacter sp. R39]
MEVGKLRPLAVASQKRLSAFSDVPTISESGYPDFDASAWYGVIGACQHGP